MSIKMKRPRDSLFMFLFLVVFQVLFIVLFGIFVEYGEDASPATNPSDNSIGSYYPSFIDVHVMMAIGFGFLMTFLRRYGFSSVGFNFLLMSFVIQWSTLVHGFIHQAGHKDLKIPINIVTLLTSDFASATILISFGAVLGKTTPLQLLVMAFIEVVVFNLNEWIGTVLLHAVDIGGSMFVHAFGAYFGLAVARVLYKKGAVDHEKEGSTYYSDQFSMIGTIFLWLFWPSFNSALAEGDQQHRAVLNTYFSLAACCFVTFAMSTIVHKQGKIEMVHVQNATLAGGVAVGTCANMLIKPFSALMLGSLAAIISVLGYRYLTPQLAKSLKIHDTCGVHNLHGLPAVLAGLAGALGAAFATSMDYQVSLFQVFPARAPLANSTHLAMIHESLPDLAPGLDYSASQQASFQLLALVVTLVMAITSGAITGLILRIPIFFKQVPTRDLFEDDRHWNLPLTTQYLDLTLTDGPNMHSTGKPLMGIEEEEISGV